MKKLLIFASGSKDGGGSGFKNLVLASQKGILKADIVGVVSNYESGGVREKAKELGINFIYFPVPFEAKSYQRIVKDASADFVALSGWLRLAKGLDSKTTINIHPGPLPEFGGAGMYGIYVHEAVLAKGVNSSAVSMHFVTEEYDEGPLFFNYPVPVKEGDTPETLQKRVNEAEHKWQPIITNMVVNGEISWDGKNPETLKVPNNYKHLN